MMDQFQPSLPWTFTSYYKRVGIFKTLFRNTKHEEVCFSTTLQLCPGD